MCTVNFYDYNYSDNNFMRQWDMGQFLWVKLEQKKNDFWMKIENSNTVIIKNMHMFANTKNLSK